MKRRVLVVDDEKLIRWSLEEKLTSWGYNVNTAADAESAYRALDKRLPDLVLLDIKLPDASGIDILAKIREKSQDVAVIMITAEATVESAVQAMKLGAYDYISKPFNLEEMQILIEKSLEKKEMGRTLDYYEAERQAGRSREKLIGESPRFTEVHQLISKVAKSPVATVLVQGESGTGKNLVARAIHTQSDRSEKPFVTIECTTIPENLLESELFGHERGAFTDAHSAKKGLFELGHTGTVFINEIGDLPTSMQVKLLRIIEDQSFKRVEGITDLHVNVRIIAATNMDLQRAVEEKRFRRDLYFRLNVVPMYLPPLRERSTDALLLADYFREEFNRQFGKSFTQISSEAKSLVLAHPWPGNVRKLRNPIERAVLLESGDEILPEHLMLSQHGIEQLSEGSPVRADAPQTIEEMEMDMIRRAIHAAEGNQTQAARILGVSRDVLRYRMKKYGLE